MRDRQADGRTEELGILVVGLYTRTFCITLGVKTFLITFTNYEKKPWRKTTTMIGLNLILSTDICVPLIAGTMSAELIRVYPIKPGKQVMSIQTIVWRKKSFLF